MSNGNKDSVLISLQNVKKWFSVRQGIIDNLLARGEPEFVRAVDGVSIDIRRGEVFGLVGESGSGKTTVGRLALRLLEPTEGKVIFDDIDLSTLSAEELRLLRSRMQVIFQDPMASLNPRMTVIDAISHPLEIHQADKIEDREEIICSILKDVGLSPPEVFLNKYPHQLSGGQRQRVVIARALVTEPDLILADEPIAMADVSVRALLLELMRFLKDEHNLTYLYITHDLATAKYICDRIGVMYLGKLVEVSDLSSVYNNPLHPYTQALMAAVPIPDPLRRRNQPLPRGEIPSPINPPSGCRFHPRCSYAEDICGRDEPELREIEPGHTVACHFAEKFT
jgi:peptide/nickel transport system ATP-binding protein